MDRIVDTLIIGGGPAGISCAVRLQKAGVPCLVVEKRSFPRDKTCGGLITEKTLRLLSLEFGFSEEERSSLLCDRSDAIRLYAKGQLLTDSTVSPGFHLTKRMLFDRRLAERYKSLGGLLLENTVCEVLDPDAHKAVLSNHDAVFFRHLVVADGAISHTRKEFGYKKQKFAFCVETQVPKTDLPQRRALEIHFGMAKTGYVWVFPSGDTYCIGIIDEEKASTRLADLLKNFLASLGLDPNAYEIKGAFVPYGNPVKQTHACDDAVLIGDAGGFADPITGEGLYFALATGVTAAEVILQGEEKIRPAFVSRMSSQVKNIRLGKRLQKTFYHPVAQKIFTKVARGRNAFVGYFCNQLVSNYERSYAEFFKLCRAYKKAKK